MPSIDASPSDATGTSRLLVLDNVDLHLANPSLESQLAADPPPSPPVGLALIDGDDAPQPSISVLIQRLSSNHIVSATIFLSPLTHAAAATHATAWPAPGPPPRASHARPPLAARPASIATTHATPPLSNRAPRSPPLAPLILSPREPNTAGPRKPLAAVLPPLTSPTSAARHKRSRRARPPMPADSSKPALPASARAAPPARCATRPSPWPIPASRANQAGSSSTAVFGPRPISSASISPEIRAGTSAQLQLYFRKRVFPMQ
nr:SH3 domain-containing protein C23A1.17-like [Lolium perenne]